MPVPKDKKLYEKIRKEIYKIYEKPSAYRSGALVRRYKSEFKKKYGDIEPYEGDDERELQRWFEEEWTDVNPFKTSQSYPVYRPLRRITEDTPLTLSEIDPKDLIIKSIQKQKIKGIKNLTPFLKKKNVV